MGDECPSKKEYKEIFQYLDADNSGDIHQAEAKGQIEAHCAENPEDDLCPKSEEDWEGLGEFFDALDADNSGSVSKKEAMKFYR